MRILTLFLLLTLPLGARIDYSVLPSIEAIENLETLSPEKYGKAQWEAMMEAAAHQQNRLRVVSYNILYDYYDHELDPGDRWSLRLPRIIELLSSYQADLIGLQELTRDKEFKAHLPKDYAFVGTPAKDGEITPFLYRTDRLTCLSSKLVTLKKGPYSLAFTQALFRDLHTNQTFIACNTHLSFSNAKRRNSQAQQLHDYLSHLDAPVILLGDCNTFPNRPDLHTLPFYDGEWVEKTLKGDLFADAKHLALFGHLGPLSTFTNNGTDPTPFKGTGTPGVILDHIFVPKETTVLIHAIDPAQVDDHYPSDHMPILADILLPQSH